MYEHKTGINFRKANKSDLNDLLMLKNESWWGTHNTLIANIDDQTKWYHSMSSNELFLIGEVKNTNVDVKVPIGVAAYTNIDYINRNLKISGSVYKPYRSVFAWDAFCAGLDFAFEIMNMHRVEAEVLEYHVPAQKIEIEGLGMKIEGRKRKAVYKCGSYYDSIVLGILRSDWQEQERIKSYDGVCNLQFNKALFDKLKKSSCN